MTAGMLVLVCMAGFTACNHTQPEERRYVIIFVDMSLSTLPDRENYKKYIDTIVGKLKAGDRLTVCKIIDLTIAEFSPIFDIEFPSFNFWTDNRTHYDKTMHHVSGQIMATIDSVLETRSKVQKSDIINSFLITHQFMHNKQGKKSLIIISDMQESSSDFDFDRDNLTPEYLDRAITSLHSKGRIPKLNDVEVWVAGAYAKDNEHFFAVQEFWKRYITETGAELRSYSHSLLDFQ